VYIILIVWYKGEKTYTVHDRNFFIEHASLGLSFPVFKGVMKKGYRLPTPIQRKASTIFKLHCTEESRLFKPPRERKLVQKIG